MKKYDNNKHQEVIKYYQQGLKIREVAKLAGVSTWCVRDWLQKHNIPIRNNLYCEDIKLAAIKLYTEQQMSINQVGRTVGASGNTVRAWLINNKIPIKVDRGGDRRVYKVNESTFNKIDTPEKAYLLGFIVGDGYVYFDANVLSITLAYKDIKHLYKLREILGSTHPVHSYNYKYHESVLSIHSKEMIKDLENIGIPHNKTFNAKPIQLNNHKLQCNFWLGIFDSDGSIHYETKSRRYCLTVTGTYDICKGFKEFFNTKYKIVKTKNIFQIGIKSNIQVYDYLTILYNEATVVLDRKYKLYKDLEACLTPQLPGLEI